MLSLQRSPHSTRVVLGVTGASGSPYAEAILLKLLKARVRTYLVFTETAEKVVNTEMSEGLLPLILKTPQNRRFEENDLLAESVKSLGLDPGDLEQLRVFDNKDFYAPIASGSEGATHMIVCPCSMGSLARIAHGMSTCLLERAADVMLKERRPLVIVPRETPLSLIHLQNMTTLVQAGAALVPAMPGFYDRPKCVADLVNFIAERVLESLGIPEWRTQRKEVSWNHRQL